MSVVLIREVFLKKVYENFVRTLETARNREISIIGNCPY